MFAMSVTVVMCMESVFIRFVERFLRMSGLVMFIFLFRSVQVLFFRNFPVKSNGQMLFVFNCLGVYIELNFRMRMQHELFVFLLNGHGA